ncbi:MAG: phage portal protein [Chitinivibrionia bacterium]|nr:phage portal protein [Chitinivibrionia bacterium]
MFNFLKKNNKKYSKTLLSGILELLQANGRVSLQNILEKGIFAEINRENSIKLSKYLYKTNEYAQGIVDRYVGKIVNTGFTCSPMPERTILNEIEQKIIDLAADKIEAIFKVWQNTPEKVSYRKKWNFGELQRITLRESLILGDVLIVVLKDKKGFPCVEIIGGDRVKNTINSSKNCVCGVEVDENTGEELGYWVIKDDGESGYVEAYGKSGRRQSWLLKANDSTAESVRGVPFLEVIMRSLHELDDSLAAEQRAMLINSLLVLTHTRAAEQSAADNVTAEKLIENLGKFTKKTISDEPNGQPKTDGNNFTITEPRKGFVLANMGAGEDVKSHDSKRPNLDVANFIMECVKTASRAKGIPPEVFLMEYNTSYSASTAAKIDFYELQRLEASRIITWLCNPIYREFLLAVSETVEMPKYREAVTSGDWIITGAWENAIWNGLQYRQVDLRNARGLEIAAANGWMTNKQIAEIYYGSNFTANVRKVFAEREMLKKINVEVEDFLFADETDETTKKQKDGNFYETDTFDGITTKAGK